MSFLLVDDPCFSLCLLLRAVILVTYRNSNYLGIIATTQVKNHVFRTLNDCCNISFKQEKSGIDSDVTCTGSIA